MHCRRNGPSITERFWCRDSRERPRGSMSKRIDAFRNATETRVLEHRAGGRGVELKVKIYLDSGKATCRLRDADGALRWEGEFGPGKLCRGACFEGSVGALSLEVGLDHATGRYTVRLADL